MTGQPVATEGAAIIPRQQRSSSSPELFTLSTGVVLRRRTPPAWVLVDIEDDMEPLRPKIPTYFNDAKGRDEENPSDPDYQGALARFNTQMNNRKYAVVVALSTSIESIPEGVFKVEDEGWVRSLALGNRHLPKDASPEERYLWWVKSVAGPAHEDWVRLMYGIQRLIGTPEEDVAAVATMFPPNEERRTD